MFLKLVMTTLVTLSVFISLSSASHEISHGEVTGRVAHAIFHEPCHHHKYEGEEPWEYEEKHCKHPLITGEVDFVEIDVEYPRTRIIGQFNSGFLVDDDDYYYQVDYYPKRPLFFIEVLPPGTAPFQVDLPFSFDYFAGKTLKIFHGNMKIGKSKIIEI